MALRSWLRPATSPASARPHLRATLETLEDRAVPTGFAHAFGAEMVSGVGSSALDADGNVYVSGGFQGAIDLDPGPATRSLTSAGGDDSFVAKFAPDGTFLWARQVAGPGAGVSANSGAWNSVAVAPNGTVAFGAAFTGPAEITGVNADGSTYSYHGGVNASGEPDALVATLSSDGTVRWVRTVGGAGATLMPRPIGVLPDGAVLIGGGFTGTADFDAAASYPGNRDVLISAGSDDMFVARLNADGSFAWAQRAGGTGTESGILSVDSVGNAYLWGRSNSPTIAFGSQTMTRKGGYDAYVSRIDSATGDFLWTRQIGGSGASVGYGGSAAYHDPNATDPNAGNAVYVSGNLYTGYGSASFGPSGPTVTRTDGWDGYLAKYDGDGNLLWAKQLEGWNHVNTAVMTTDAAGDVYSHVYLTGTGVVDFDPGPAEALVDQRSGATTDGYLLKLSAAGDFRSVRPAGRFAMPAVGADGSVSVFGTYDAATSGFDTGSGQVTLPSPAGDARDFYLVKVDQDDRGGVFGRVLYPSGYPVEGATVTLKQNGLVVATTTAGAFGEYSFRHMAAGTYSVEAAGGSLTVSLTAGQFLSGRTVVATAPSEGTKFFVVNDGTTDRTFQYGAVGSTNANTALATGNTAPRGAASNAQGTRVWVLDANRTVYVYSPSGSLLGSWTTGLSSKAVVEGITTNGTDIWIVAAEGRVGRLYKFTGAASRLSGTQKAASNFALATYNTNPKGVVTDGSSFWVVDDSATDTVYKYTLGGSLLGGWRIDPANGSPTGITLDPNNVGHLWIVDSAALKVFQYSNAATFPGDYLIADRTFALTAGNTNPQDIADPPSDELAISLAPLSFLAGPFGLIGHQSWVEPHQGDAPAPARAGRTEGLAFLSRKDPRASGTGR